MQNVTKCLLDKKLSTNVKELTKSKLNSLISYLNLYKVFTKIQRRVWKYVQNFFYTTKKVFASISTIAKECKCSIRTVQYSLKLFIELGWLIRTIRPYRTNDLYIPDQYIKFKITTLKACDELIEKFEKMMRDPPPIKPKISETNLHPFCTISNVSNNTYIDRSNYIQKTKKNDEVFHMLSQYSFIKERDLAYFSQFRPCVMAQALERAKEQQHYLKKKGQSIGNMAAFLNKKCSEVINKYYIPQEKAWKM